MKFKLTRFTFPDRKVDKLNLLRMKLTFALLICMVMQSFAGVYSQTRINLDYQNESISEIFNFIGKKTGYTVFYSSVDLNPDTRVSINIQDAEINEIMESVLEGTDLTFTIIDDLIAISKIEKQDEEFSLDLQKEITIKGKVVDTDGIPLPGATLLENGTLNGVTTDDDGQFEFEVASSKSILKISFIGFETQFIQVGEKTDFLITLIESSTNLDEVVITGYQSIEKGRATGSFEILNNDDMNKIFALDYKSKLEGAASGVYVDANNKITIRGTATLYAETEPLYVVDGIPLPEGSDLNLNTNDIENVSILKDAASASIWGIRAANGVIVITTKRGEKSKKMNVAYSSNVKIDKKINLADGHYMSASDYVDLEWNHYNNNGFPSIYVNFLNWGYTRVGEVYKDRTDWFTPITEQEATDRLNTLKSFDNQREKENLYYRNAMTQKHNIRISGGSDKATYYTSLNYDRNLMSIKGNENDRINILSNIDYKITDKINFKLGLRGTYRNEKLNGENPSSLLPYERTLDDNGNYLDQYNQGFGSVSKSYRSQLESMGFLNWNRNLLEMTRMNDKTNTTLDVAINIGFDVKFLKHFKFTTYANYETGRGKYRQLYSSDHYYTRNLVNKYTDLFTMENHIPIGSVLGLNYATTETYSLRNVLEFENSYGKIKVKALFGNEINSLKVKNEESWFYGFNEQTLNFSPVDYKALSSSELKGFDGQNTLFSNPNDISEGIDKFASFFGSASVTYDNKYDLFASWRLDKTNVYTTSSNFRNNPSWSVGGKWQISKEKFFNSNIINNLALKVSYGLYGNIEKRTSPQLVGRAFLDIRTGREQLYASNPENKSLGWEKTNSLNIGVVFGLLDNKLSGEIEYYNRKSSNVLADEDLDLTTGWVSTRKNSANIKNNGVDLSLSATILNKTDFSWNTDFNFSYNFNEITEMNSFAPDVSNIIIGYFTKGYATDGFHIFRSAGIDETGEPLVYNANNEALSWTEIKSFSTDDIVYAGRKTPPYYGSITNTLKYKEFTLSFMFTYKFGHKVLLPGMNTWGIGNGQLNEWMADFWKEAGDEATVKFPKLPGTMYEDLNRTWAHSVNDKLLDKGDILRLRTLTLSYNLDKVLKKTPFSGSVSFSAENVWYWAANKYDLDSDYLSVGPFGGNYNIPQPASFIIGLNLNF